MKRHLQSLFLFLILGCLAFAAEKLTVEQLLKDAKKFDGKEITLTGKVDKFQQKTSRAGNDYFVFKLVDKQDKKALVNVYGQGKPKKEPKNGDVVELKGMYRVEKKFGNSVYKNELQIKPEDIKTLEPAK